jgi:hypothetical protein
VKVIDPGHMYDLQCLDANLTVRLVFVKREGPGYPGNVGSYPGTNLQEVIRALIDRVKYLDGQIYSHHNSRVIHGLRIALHSLEVRAAERHGRELAAQSQRIECLPTCETCGHVECSAHSEVRS